MVMMHSGAASASPGVDAGGGRRPDGPPAGVLALIALGLTTAAVVMPLAMSRSVFPSPAVPADEVATYLTGNGRAVTLAGFFTFGASVPVGIYSATIYARLVRLGVRVPGPNIAFFGGISASVLLAAAGLLTWSLAGSAVGVPSAVLRLLVDLVFALGGIGFVGGLGLLMAGVAVPALILRLVPRWLAWVGLGLAVASEVSFLGLLWWGFDLLLPLGRFAGLLWLAAVGFVLPRTRHDVSTRPERRR